MFLDKFLTEYDDSLGAELNVDPLGLQVIWSAFGQQIFRNRISSISNDVRNYTLNLFNHWLIRKLIQDDTAKLSKPLQHTYPNKTDLNFKYACLIFLENLYVYSMIHHQQQRGVNTQGVLGISNARRNWEAASHNPVLLFGHDQKAQVLVRQIVLGVSGRYKTPLVELGFFDRHYQYEQPKALPLWQQMDELVANTPVLSTLADELYDCLKALMAEKSRKPQLTFDEIPESLIQALVKAFPSQAAVGQYACDFWLGITKLNQGAAGALYQAIKPSAERDINSPPIADVFAQALTQDLSHSDKARLAQVRLLEPFLAELDLMFGLMLSRKSQPLSEVVERWRAMNRANSTLHDLAVPIATNAAMFNVLSGTGKARLERLLKLAECGDVSSQITQLLEYHGGVMQSRGQLPWLKLRDDGTLALSVRPRREPEKDQRPVGTWVNRYYIPQFRNLLAGLWGLAA